MIHYFLKLFCLIRPKEQSFFVTVEDSFYFLPGGSIFNICGIHQLLGLPGDPVGDQVYIVYTQRILMIKDVCPGGAVAFGPAI